MYLLGRQEQVHFVIQAPQLKRMLIWEYLKSFPLSDAGGKHVPKLVLVSQSERFLTDLPHYLQSILLHQLHVNLLASFTLVTHRSVMTFWRSVLYWVVSSNGPFTIIITDIFQHRYRGNITSITVFIITLITIN